MPPERLKMLRLNREELVTRIQKVRGNSGMAGLPEPSTQQGCKPEQLHQYKDPREAKGGPGQLAGGRKENQAYGTEQQSQPQRRTVGTGVLEASAVLGPVSGPFPGDEPSTNSNEAQDSTAQTSAAEHNLLWQAEKRNVKIRSRGWGREAA